MARDRGRLLAFGAIVALSEARFWPNPGNLWLAAALAGGAIVWWQVSTHSSRRPAAPATATSRGERAARSAGTASPLAAAGRRPDC